MKIVIAPDSFKGSMDSITAGQKIQEGILKILPDTETIIIPISDGGEGFIDAVLASSGGRVKTQTVTGPNNKEISSRFGIHEDTAVIEMAAASGLTLVPEKERNPLKATTFGTGELIKAAIDSGFRKILIGLGGSATCDGGAGMAQALGYNLLDKNNEELPPGGGELNNLSSIKQNKVSPDLAKTKITIASDVRNPLLGPNGAIYTYARQKGADDQMMMQLEKNLEHFKHMVNFFFRTDFSEMPGAGAAGGLGFGLLSFCSAEIRSGIDIILDTAHFDDLLETTDLVVTGEGRIDGQSLQGKVPVGIAARAVRKKVPVLALVGDIGGRLDKIHESGITAVLSTVNRAMPLKEAMTFSAPLLSEAAEQAFRIIKLGKTLKG